MPVVDIAKRDECLGVKLTKDVVIVEAGEEMLALKRDTTASDEIVETFWRAEMDSSNSRTVRRTRKDVQCVRNVSDFQMVHQRHGYSLSQLPQPS